MNSKRSRVFLLVILLFSFKSFSQCNIRTTNTTSSLYDLKYGDNSTVYAVGEGGYILKSSDGGDNWKVISSCIRFTLKKVFTIGKDTVYAVGVGGTAIKTVNGGASWDILNLNTTVELNSLYFFNSHKGFVVDDNGGSYYTEDGGITWNVQKLSSDRLRVISFINDSTGFIAAENTIYKTKNRGISWRAVSAVELFPSDIHFINEKIGYAVGNKLFMLKTINGGESWEKMDVGHNYFNSVYFINENEGFAICGEYLSRVIKTDDGGKTWKDVYDYVEGSFHSIEFSPDKSKGLIVGGSEYYNDEITGNIILRYSFSSKQFETLSSSLNRSYVEFTFLDREVGYQAIGNAFKKTTDGGITWKRHNLPKDINLSYLKFYDLNRAVGYNNENIFETSDGGITWTSYPKQIHYHAKVKFITDTEWLLFNGDGQIYHTNDGGKHYETTDDVSWGFYSFDFIDKNIGYGVNGTAVLKTIDGGKTWDLAGDPGKFLKVIDFIDEEVGYAGGSEGEVLKTIDGGANWTHLATFEYGTITDIKFSSAREGMVIPSGYEIYKTIDGGTTWTSSFLSSYHDDHLSHIVYAGEEATLFASSKGTLVWSDTIDYICNPSYIAGSRESCLEKSVYSVVEQFGVTYNWTVSSGGVYSVKDNIMTVNWIEHGKHKITLYTNDDCNSSEERIFKVDVLVKPPTPAITLADSFLVSSSLEGNQWILEKDTLKGETGTQIKMKQKGAYKVIVANKCGFAVSETFNSIVLATEDPLKVLFKIYPNPATTTVTIDAPSLHSIKKLEILDCVGNIVATYINPPGSVNIEDYSRGTYLFRIDTGKELFVAKVIKTDL